LHTINKSTWKNLRYLNLEENGIETWDELKNFRELNDLRQLVINKNFIKEITLVSGFRGLKMLSFEENLINDWHTFDQLN
jgi:hypothetical protein